MIAKIIPGSYDIEGKQVSQPRVRHGFQSTFPMATYLTQPLTLQCAELEGVRRFLATCVYISDLEQFNRKDFWMPPEDFEKKRKGDCEDFALWTWRQMLALGYDARYVVGHNSRGGRSHAWLTYRDDKDQYIVEPLAAFYGPSFPRISSLSMCPRMSASWDGSSLKYFEHIDLPFSPGLPVLISLISESILYWIVLWLRAGLLLTQKLIKLTFVFMRGPIRRRKN